MKRFPTPARSASAGVFCLPVACAPGWWVILLLLLTTSAGCNRQDAECLSRIGRKVSAHAKSSAGDVGAKLELSWLGSKRELTLQEKIHDRLRWESILSDVTFEVHVKDKEVELKGTVQGALQRQRAIELAETVAGVEKVTTVIVVREADEAAK